MDKIMKERVKNDCELFVKNYETLKNNFKWENSYMHYISSCIYTRKGQEVNPDKIKECIHVIKDNTGIFSYFRGIPLFALATTLSLENNPIDQFKKSVDIYNLMKAEFSRNTYLPTVSLMIANFKNDNLDYSPIIHKGKELYKEIKKKHPFLTSNEDIAFLIFFALKDMSIETITQKIENCYTILKDNIKGGNNPIQALSFILALRDEESSISCRRAIKLYNLLLENNLKFGYGMELSILGLLIGQTDENNEDEVVENIIEVYDYLKNKKGFGSFSMSKAQRLMYSSIIVSNEFEENVLDSTINSISISNTVISSMIAQEAAMIAIIAATSAAAANSSSSGS